jgi:hypothetical protein
MFLILGTNVNLCNTSLQVAINTETAAIRVPIADYRLEISTHPEGPVNNQLEPGFVTFLGRRTNDEQLPKSTLNCTLLIQPSQRHQNFVIMLPSKHKFEPKLSTCSLSCRLHTVHFPSPDLHYQTLYLIYGLPLPEGRGGTASEPSKQPRFTTPP